MWQRDRRLSTLCDLAVSTDGGSIELPADIAAALPALIVLENERCAPAPIDVMGAALTATLSLLGGVMGQEDRTNWQIVAQVELQDLPADLALEGLKIARRKCERPAQVVPAVFEYAENSAKRRRARRDGLIALAHAAGIPFERTSK